MNEKVVKSADGSLSTEKGTQLHADVVYTCTGAKPNTGFMKDKFAACLDDQGCIKVRLRRRQLCLPMELLPRGGLCTWIGYSCSQAPGFPTFPVLHLQLPFAASRCRIAVWRVSAAPGSVPKVGSLCTGHMFIRGKLVPTLEGLCMFFCTSCRMRQEGISMLVMHQWRSLPNPGCMDTPDTSESPLKFSELVVPPQFPT